MKQTSVYKSIDTSDQCSPGKRSWEERDLVFFCYRMAEKMQTDTEMTEAQENRLIEYTPTDRHKEQGARPKERSERTHRSRRDSTSSSRERYSSRSSTRRRKHYRHEKTSCSTQHRSPPIPPVPEVRPQPPLRQVQPPSLPPAPPLLPADLGRSETRKY